MVKEYTVVTNLSMLDWPPRKAKKRASRRASRDQIVCLRKGIVADVADDEVGSPDEISSQEPKNQHKVEMKIPSPISASDDNFVDTPLVL